MAKSRYEYVKEFETYASILPRTWMVARVDGRSFNKVYFIQFTKDHGFIKPNDSRGISLLVHVAQCVCQKFTDIVLAYGQSDEFSFVFKKKAKLFNRRSDKIISTIVSYFTSCYVFYWNKYFDIPLQYPPSFDARVVCYPNDDILIDYLRWRQSDCHVNNLYNTLFWGLVAAGATEVQAHNRIKGTDSGQKHEIMYSELGINYNDEPVLFKKGTILLAPDYAPRHVDIFHKEFYLDNNLLDD